jgi:hypothetical protein
MKLDPKANDRVRSSWRLRKSIPSSFREDRESYLRKRVSGKCKDRVLGELAAREKGTAVLLAFASK